MMRLNPNTEIIARFMSYIQVDQYDRKRYYQENREAILARRKEAGANDSKP